MGQAEYHFIMYLCYALVNHFALHARYTFSLFDYYSCFRMVMKFYCLIISIMLMLGFYDSSYVCFYTLIDQSSVTACHLKNYLFVITYLLEDE